MSWQQLIGFGSLKQMNCWINSKHLVHYCLITVIHKDLGYDVFSYTVAYDHNQLTGSILLARIHSPSKSASFCWRSIILYDRVVKMVDIFNAAMATAAVSVPTLTKTASRRTVRCSYSVALLCWMKSIQYTICVLRTCSVRITGFRIFHIYPKTAKIGNPNDWRYTIPIRFELSTPTT